MKPKSVKKKLKQPSFAAGVNRDDVARAPRSWASTSTSTSPKVIAAMEERADLLGLGPREDAAA